MNRIRQHLTLATRDRKQHPSLARAVQQWEATAATVLDQDPSRWVSEIASRGTEQAKAAAGG